MELLLVASLHSLGDDLLAMDVLLERQQNLVGIDRLDKIVGNLLTDSLIHNVLFFALRYHDNRHLRGNLLDTLQRLQAREARHHLIEQHQVKGALLAFLDGVRAIGHRNDLIAFLL